MIIMSIELTYAIIYGLGVVTGMLMMYVGGSND